MIDYPFMKCLNPQRVYNTKGEEIVVPCRCCRACLMNKANKMTFQCSLEEEDSKYCIFVTLTYANDFVPLLQPVACKNSHGDNLGYILYNKCDRLSALGSTLGFDEAQRHTSNDYMRYFLDKVKLNGFIPYLSPLDFQRFMKRFRKNLNKYSDEKIRYYACGEYGPRTFRPHFHMLLFFNEKITFENYAKCLRAAWPYGRIDASSSRSKCASYVARYVNSTVALPRLYEISSLKPFSSHSTFFGQSFYKSQKAKIYESEPTDFIRQCRNVLGRNVSFMPWRSLTSSFFPRCREFNGKSYSELLQSYTILQRAQAIYGNYPVSYLAEAIYSDCRDNECTRYFAYAYEIEGKRKKIDLRKFNAFTPQSVPYPVLTVDDIELNGWQRAMNAITSELYISKHFLDFVCDNRSYTEIHRKIYKIKHFYDVLDYEHLKNWYEQQEDYFRDTTRSIRDMFLFFDNVHINPSEYRKNTDAVKTWLLNLGFGDPSCITFPDDCDSIKNNLLYKAYRSEITERFNNSIKHKKLNDANKIFIYETF